MNRTGYESLKSKGFEIIENDSLRFQIISLYDYNYQILHKLEEEVPEMQAFLSFYDEISQVISPYLRFDEKGRVVGINQPINLSTAAENTFLGALWRIENNRRFKLNRYQQTLEAIQELIEHIEKELS